MITIAEPTVVSLLFRADGKTKIPCDELFPKAAGAQRSFPDLKDNSDFRRNAWAFDFDGWLSDVFNLKSR